MHAKYARAKQQQKTIKNNKKAPNHPSKHHLKNCQNMKTKSNTIPATIKVIGQTLFLYGLLG
jgi:hypothetical protein